MRRRGRRFRDRDDRLAIVRQAHAGVAAAVFAHGAHAVAVANEGVVHGLVDHAGALAKTGRLVAFAVGVHGGAVPSIRSEANVY